MSQLQRGDSLHMSAFHVPCIIDFQDHTNPGRVQNLFASTVQRDRTKSSWDDLAYKKYRMDFENETNEALLDIFALSSNSKSFSQKLDKSNPAGCFKMASSFERISPTTTYDSPEPAYLKVTPMKTRSKMISGSNATTTSVTSFSSTMWSGIDTRNVSDCSSDCEEKNSSNDGSMSKLDSPNKMTETTPTTSGRRTVRMLEAVEEMWNRPCHINPPQCRTLLYSLWD